MSIGKGTNTAKMLSGFVYEVEQIEADQEELRDSKAAIFARAKEMGFTTGVLRAVIKIRKEKPHDRAEFQSILDSYLHALGMDEAPALFRHVGMMGVDLASREAVIDALKLLVPEHGEMIVKTKDGKPVRLFRDHEGNAQVEDFVEPEPFTPKSPGAGEEGWSPPEPRRPEREVPDVSDKDAEGLGVTAFKENKAITANPFPFDDKRRPRWDKGWRNGAANEAADKYIPKPKKGEKKGTGDSGLGEGEKKDEGQGAESEGGEEK